MAIGEAGQGSTSARKKTPHADGDAVESSSSGRPWVDVAAVLRKQRQLAQMSLRGLASITQVSDSYLSQLERGLHEPSPEILKKIAAALNLPINALYERLGWLDDSPKTEATASAAVETAIAADERLSPTQKHALQQMYRTLVGDAD